MGRLEVLEQKEVQLKPSAHPSQVASVVTGRKRRNLLQQELDKMFPSGTRENRTLSDLVQRYPKVFALDSDPLNVSTKFLVSIPMEGPPCFVRPYPLAVKYYKEVSKQIEEIIEHTIGASG